MFYADPESMPATPTVDHPSAINFPTMQSEAPTSDSPMSGSQLLSRAHASNAGDSTPRHTAHGLSVGQAEIIRKRHEDEVAALGAEVLAQTRRNTQRRQASTSVMPFTPATATAGEATSTDKGANKPALQSTAPSGTSTPLGTASTSRDSAFEKNALTRAVGSMMRKATADSDRTVRSGNEDGPLIGSSSSNNTKKKVEPTLPLVTEPETGGPQQSMPVRSPVQRSDSPESVRSRKSVSDVVTPAKSVSSLHGTSAPSTHSPLSKRMMTNASISTPAPSPWLPRRPDARGLAVVPLPQLGIRPERPHEGRVWQYDVDDESDIEAAASDKEDEGSDLDAEELEEEELKTAMQKKRATTLAAGQEVVHASLESKAKATSRAGKVSSSSYDVEPLRSSKLYSAKRRSSVAGSRQNGPAVPSGPKRAPPRLVRTVTSTSSRQNDAEDDSDDDIDEKDLWPAASATSKTGTPRPRHILVNLPGGPGIWDTKTGGGKNAVAAINSVAAARARAIKKRADKRVSYDLPAGWRDEMMDYGWGRSAV